MPAHDGLGSHDGNRMDHFAEQASGQGEEDAISGADARLGH